MTLILGIKCTDGVVIGADRALTEGDHIIQIESKVHIIGDHALVGVAGELSTAQAIVHSIQTLYQSHDPFLHQQVFDVAKELGKCVNAAICDRADLQRRYLHARGLSGSSWADSWSLIALPTGGSHHLIKFQWDGSPIVVESPCFAAIGSGDQTAMSVLTFLSETLWRGLGPPSLPMGRMTATWVLDYALEHRDKGVAFGPNLYVLQEDRSDQEIGWEAVELENDDLEETRSTVDDLKHGLKSAAEMYLRSGRIEEPPRMPPLEN